MRETEKPPGSTDEIGHYMGACARLRQELNECQAKLQQARQEVAREILEEIESLIERVGVEGISIPVLNAKAFESLKSKYIGVKEAQ